MSRAVVAIDRRARDVTLTTCSEGEHNENGDWVPGAAVSRIISAAIFPNSRTENGNMASGNKLTDDPEGKRTEAGWLIWTREQVKLDDEITDGTVVYRVMYVWPRPEGGFNRAAIGRMTP